MAPIVNSGKASGRLRRAETALDCSGSAGGNGTVAAGFVVAGPLSGQASWIGTDDCIPGHIFSGHVFSIGDVWGLNFSYYTNICQINPLAKADSAPYTNLPRGRADP